MKRRDFISIGSVATAMGAVAVSRSRGVRAAGNEGVPSGASHAEKLFHYVNVNCEMLQYEVDVDAASLVKRGSIILPAIPQYAWLHSNRRFLYVACSNYYLDRQPTQSYVVALRIDPQTGALSKHGEPVQLTARPIHLSTDIPSEYLLLAFNNPPAGVRVFRINEDGTVGGEVPQPGVTDPGIFPHQIRVTPDNRHATLMTRGFGGAPDKPGAIKLFDYERGVLGNETSMGGSGFNPRHLDFHPTQSWAYVVLETQNQLCTYRLENGQLAAEPVFRTTTLAERDKTYRYELGWGQIAGAVHVHPNGQFVYVVNRADGTVDVEGNPVFAGGENNVAVCGIDQATGEPRLIQHIDTRRCFPHTFAIDPGGRLMAVYNTESMTYRDERQVTPGVTIYRICADGTLSFERVYDMGGFFDGDSWNGMVSL
jgi:6-phosphogluconolactonase (cycloisomerase 2 family)